ncbi:MAG: hypothetical protein CL912_13885 [Deltaproteobacteria bacterium]|nr:hypothetical protein [Deltaproteobacteria bacterium]
MQSERGLQLESEWDKSQLCWMILAAFLFSLVVTGVSAGASRDWQIGLAAGGLVVALESFVVGAVAVNDKFR